MFFKIVILLLLSLLSSLSLSLSTTTSTSTSLSNNIDYKLLSSLNNKINDYKHQQHQHQHHHHPQHHHHHHHNNPQQQHHHHQELIGDFILPIDLSSTLGMIITKNSDPFVIATESIGDNIKKVSSWEKVDNTKDKDLLYARDISYIHNRKSSSSSTSSLSSLFGPKATSHELIQLLQLNEKNFEDHHHHDYHAKLVGFMNLSHVPYCHNTSYITLWDFCSFRGRDDNRDFIMTHVKVSLTIDGLQPSMYKSIIKNSIITDIKHYVEEFRLASMNQLNHNYNNYNHLNNDEIVLLNIINNKKQSLINSKHINNNNNKDTVVNNNKLDSNFWTLPTTSGDATMTIPAITLLNKLDSNFWTLPTISGDATMTIPAITLLSSYLLYYKQKLKGILINLLISSSSSSSSTTSSSLSSLLKKNNIISKLRTSFGQLIMKKSLMKNINIRKIF